MLSSGSMSPRRGLSLSSSWNEKNSPLPLPTSSKRSQRPLSVPARIKRRWPLLLALAVASLIAMSYFSSPSTGVGLNDSPSFAAEIQTPDRVGQPGSAGGFEREPHGAAEEDVMAKDDLFVQRQEDTKARTPKQIEADEEAARVKKETEAEAKTDKLRALIWWIARGGMFPADYRHPSSGTLGKMSQKTFEDLLTDVEGTDENVFLGGWQDEANMAQRVTVFSKSYCPFSMRAKDILSEYPIHPDPYVIELDQREDMTTLQDLLLHLTGRRTVPNVLIKFKSIGGADETQLLHHEGVLQRHLSIADVTFQDWTRDASP